jgi:hypothetical protein
LDEAGENISLISQKSGLINCWAIYLLIIY